MRVGMITGAMCALLLATPAHAQRQDEDDIVVTAPELEEAARAFAREVSTPPARENQLARFEQSICPGVVGLGARQGQYIVDRIAQRALQVELQVGEPGCQANVLVIVTPDAAAAARALAQEELYLMANYGVRENLSTRGAEALTDFVETSRPVRWWHVSQTETADGDVLGHTNPYGRPTGMFSQDFRGAEVTRPQLSNFGRLARTTQQAVRNVVVIVDAQQSAHVRLDALADYIAMVALAQTDPRADTSSYDTILNLFGDVASESAGLTEWDLAYLQGVYAGRGNQLDSGAQTRTIARRMREELTTP